MLEDLFFQGVYMKTKDVIVLPYNPLWKDCFDDIRRELDHVLKSFALSIEHVGSTSVALCPAKPIIDIDIIINRDDFDEVKKRLESLGYHHEGNLGIMDREAFKYEDKRHLMKHHLYVCPKDSMEYKRHLAFRDYLRTHDDERDLYGKLKMELAAKYPQDIDRYIEGKTPFISSIYQKIGL